MNYAIFLGADGGHYAALLTGWAQSLAAGPAGRHHGADQHTARQAQRYPHTADRQCCHPTSPPLPPRRSGGREPCQAGAPQPGPRLVPVLVAGAVVVVHVVLPLFCRGGPRLCRRCRASAVAETFQCRRSHSPIGGRHRCPRPPRIPAGEDGETVPKPPAGHAGRRRPGPGHRGRPGVAVTQAPSGGPTLPRPPPPCLPPQVAGRTREPGSRRAPAPGRTRCSPGSPGRCPLRRWSRSPNCLA
jgi:hypothetical protein